jgi:hypothetical protein
MSILSEPGYWIIVREEGYLRPLPVGNSGSIDGLRYSAQEAATELVRLWQKGQTISFGWLHGKVRTALDHAQSRCANPTPPPGENARYWRAMNPAIYVFDPR